MILLDQRRGSGELFEHLSRKVPCQLEILPAGDFAFEGLTEAGRQMVGVERKRIGDMLDSIVTGRFSGFQLIEMVDYYTELHLVVEGLWRPNRDTGLLEIYRQGGWGPTSKGNRTFMYADLQNFLTTISLKTPVRVWRTTNGLETVEVVADLFHWHEKPWDKHTSHLQLHRTAKPGERASFRKPSLRRRIANELPHIGWERSKAVEDTFVNDEEFISFLASANADDWMGIDGIGKGIAESIVRVLRGKGSCHD